MNATNEHEQKVEAGESPFLLIPEGKSYLWGGRRLKDEFSKQINLLPLAETWECSTHPDGQSIIASGKYKGKSLAEVLKSHPELLGTHSNGEGELPILIKLIDAKSDLSVQLHPDDLYAMEHEGGALGKTEFWYILDAAKGSTLTYGFQKEMSKEQVRECVENGTIEKYLQKIKIKNNEVYYVPAGCVHAIGAGILLVEIQENSNVTYRLYDYKRKNAEGNLRDLQVDKALEVANLKKSVVPTQPKRVLRFSYGYVTETLCICKYFFVERIQLSTEQCSKLAVYNVSRDSFQVFLCIEGSGAFYWRENRIFTFKKGDCIFIPATSAQIKMYGQAKFIKVKC